MQTIDLPDWLYWMIPRVCLVAGLLALPMLDGWEHVPALMAAAYGGIILAVRSLDL